MNTGDFIAIDYIGKVKDTGEIFDLTKEDVAKKEKIYNSRVRYEPIKIIVDAGFLIKGLEDALKEMKVGERKMIEIEPERAFGERKAELMKLIPLSVFKEQHVEPSPGSYVTINKIQGRVISVDGGRVRVDFNHPLAGKKLEYNLEVKSQITDTKEKIKSIVSYFTNLEEKEIEIALNSKEAEIKLKTEREVPQDVKKRIADMIIKWVREAEQVKFADVYGK